MKLTKSKDKKKSDGKHYFKYSITHQIIQKAYFDLFIDRKNLPTQNQVAEKTKLSKRTITRHLKELTFDNLKVEYQNLTPNVMVGLAARASTGRAREVEIWFKLVHGWVDKTDHNVSLNDNTDLSAEQKEKMGLALMADSKIQIKKNE